MADAGKPPGKPRGRGDDAGDRNQRSHRVVSSIEFGDDGVNAIRNSSSCPKVRSSSAIIRSMRARNAFLVYARARVVFSIMLQR